MTETLPLAVDLDGTLIRTDLFAKAMHKILRTPRAPLLLVWLTRGRAYAKHKLARIFPCDPATLPYDERVLAWLKQQRAQGRTLTLATGSDQSDADRVAGYLGLFDHTFGSNGVDNLKAGRKARKLAETFPNGFVYAGNEGADWIVWEAAKAAVVANASPALARRAEARFTIEKIFPAQRNTNNR